MPRNLDLPLIGIVAAALVVALVVALVATPVVKNLAIRVKAVDVPKDGRRMHDHPIPRTGGLAIFLGFLLSVLLFLDLNAQMRGMLLGAVIIVVLGIFDDIYSLRAMFKFVVQIIRRPGCGALGNADRDVCPTPTRFPRDPYWNLGILAVPATVIWIVAITNAANLIDGLDGLACGVSTISSITLLVIALVVSEANVAILMAALAGGCIGFLPYNMNPRHTRSRATRAPTFLGYILAVVSIQGLFKFYAIISFAVPFLMLGLPIFDTCFAFIRRIAHGQSPMHADRSHVHHRLIDMGFNQKQAVAVLYVISAILGPSAVVLTTSGPVKAMLLLLALCFAGAISARTSWAPTVRKTTVRSRTRRGKRNEAGARHDHLRHPAGGHQRWLPWVGGAPAPSGPGAGLLCDGPAPGDARFRAGDSPAPARLRSEHHGAPPDPLHHHLQVPAGHGGGAGAGQTRPGAGPVGDTSTTFAGALAAFYHQIRVGHVEAGLRTGDKYSPFPEGMNRKLVGDIADLHFCPTRANRANLEREGITDGVFVTGNTVIDALKTTVVKDHPLHNGSLSTHLDYTGRKITPGDLPPAGELRPAHG